jgi:hypothetical protein
VTKFKPRNQWHTFWNAGDEPARILEIISPAGFEEFFRERRVAQAQAAARDMRLQLKVLSSDLRRSMQFLQSMLGASM